MLRIHRRWRQGHGTIGNAFQKKSVAAGMSRYLVLPADNDTDIPDSSSLTEEEDSQTSALTNTGFIRNPGQFEEDRRSQFISVTQEQASETKIFLPYLSFGW